MKLLLCDDEKSILDQMCLHALRSGDNRIRVYAAQTSEEAKRHIEEQQLDAAIFDVDIDETNGIELARIFKSNHPKGLVVFATAYTSYAYDAFQVEAFKYLLKPLEEGAFKRLLVDMETMILEQDYLNQHLKKTVVIRTSTAHVTVSISDILYIERIDRKILYRTISGAYLTTEKLSDVLNVLPKDQFIQCHQGYIINISQIKILDKLSVTMGNEKMAIPISRGNYDAVKRAFNQRIWGI